MKKTKKMTESDPKKLKHFHSKEELKTLALGSQWDLLEKALRENDAEAAINTAKKRAGENFKVMRDILFQKTLYWDIRDLLNWSIKYPVMAFILKENEFWEKKIRIDFPEIFQTKMWSKFDKDWNIQKEYFDKGKARNVYMVLRYLINSVRKQLFDDSRENFVTPHVLLKFEWVGWDKILCKTYTVEDGHEKFRVSYDISFFQWIQDGAPEWAKDNNPQTYLKNWTKWFNQVNTLNFWNIVDDDEPSPDDYIQHYGSDWRKKYASLKVHKNPFQSAALFFWFQYYEPTVPVPMIHEPRNLRLSDLFDRGYYKKNDKGVVVIG